MSVSEIKQQLHKAIDNSKNKELLLTILSQSRVQATAYQLTDEQIHILQEREEKYLKGESKTQTLDEFRTKMNKKYGVANC